MATNNVCPSCGAPLEDDTLTECPSCGSALPPHSSSAKTIISNKSSFNSSAEVMDEVKKLAGEGNMEAAAQIAGAEFELNQSDAMATVEQVKFDMKQFSSQTPPPEPEPVSSWAHPDVIDAPKYEPPKKTSSGNPWIVGCSIAAVIFLCCCCVLPFVTWLVLIRNGR